MNVNYTDWSIEVEWGREKTFCLEWKIIDHEISFFWIKLFYECLKKETPLKSRYVGFIRGERDEHFVGNLLNECIETINRDGRYNIVQKFSGVITQELLNQIHDHFSTLIGDESFKSDYWKESNREVRSAICGLNDYVHELESWDRASKAHDKPLAYITSEFFEASALEIKDSWNDLFQLDGSFGDLCLHYDQIGKTWLEVMIDEDESIVKEDIRPLSRLTGSFNINFFEVAQEDILKTIRPYAKERNIDLSEESLRLGQCCIGHLVYKDIDKDINKDINKEEVMKEISKKLDISKISLKKKNKVIIHSNFPQTQERYFSERK